MDICFFSICVHKNTTYSYRIFDICEICSRRRRDREIERQIQTAGVRARSPCNPILLAFGIFVWLAALRTCIEYKKIILYVLISAVVQLYVCVRRALECIVTIGRQWLAALLLVNQHWRWQSFSCTNTQTFSPWLCSDIIVGLLQLFCIHSSHNGSTIGKTK